jgi:hypothetical protein
MQSDLHPILIFSVLTTRRTYGMACTSTGADSDVDSCGMAQHTSHIFVAVHLEATEDCSRVCSKAHVEAVHSRHFKIVGSLLVQLDEFLWRITSGLLLVSKLTSRVQRRIP